MAQFHKKTSFLRNAKVNDFYLDLNELPRMPKSAGDDRYVIESKYDKRPDLLAHKFYGDSNLWWVFALRNPDLLIDPLEDFTAGKEIRIPSGKSIDAVTG